MSLSLALPDDVATRALGAALAPLLGAGDVIALQGGLGAGKTTLARGVVRALIGAETDVPSPTFTLVQTYATPNFDLWHFDLYRLEKAEDVLELGWEDTGDGVILVEWPDRAGPFLPARRLDIRLEETPNGRIAHLEPHGEDWQNRLHGFRFDPA